MKIINDGVMADIVYDGRNSSIMIAVEDLSDYSNHDLRYVCGYIHKKEIPTLQAIIDEYLRTVKEHEEKISYKEYYKKESE